MKNLKNKTNQKTALLIILFLMSGAVFGQSRIKVKEQHGEMFKQKGSSIVDVMKLPSSGYLAITTGVVGNGFVSLTGGSSLSKPMIYLQKLDDNMNLIEEKHLSLKVAGKRLQYEKLVRFQKDYYIFLSFWNKEKGKRYLFYTRLDYHDVRLDGNLIKVAEVKMGEKTSGYTTEEFDISVSDNEKFIVIFGKDAKKIKTEKKRLFRRTRKSTSNVGTHNFSFTYWLLNKDLEIVNYEKKHKLRIEESSDKFYVRDYAIDDNGAIYILGKNAIVDDLTRAEVRKNKRATWVDIHKSAFILEKINPNGSTEQQSTPEDELFIDMDILFSNDGSVNLVGLNGEQVYSKLVTTGMSRIVFDNENLDILDVTKADLDKVVLESVNDILEAENSEHLSKSRKKRLKKRKDRRESRMTAEQKAFEEIKERAALNANFIAFSGLDENGDAVIILEEQHLRVVTHTYTDANGNRHTTTTYYYHYDDLILVKFIEGEVVQNFYKKSYVSVNVPLAKSLDASLDGGEISIMTQGHIVKADYDLENVKDVELAAFSRNDRIQGMRKKFFTYRKAVDENTILAPAQSGKKMAWYKIQVK